MPEPTCRKPAASPVNATDLVVGTCVREPVLDVRGNLDERAWLGVPELLAELDTAGAAQEIERVVAAVVRRRGSAARPEFCQLRTEQRAENNWLPVSALVRPMEELGVDGPAVRSSVSRLKHRDVLTSAREDGAAGYSLSQSALDVIADGDSRIFDRRRALEDDGWVVLVFSVPESQRDKRHIIRTTLTRLGFGKAAPGVWIAPGYLATATREMLERRGLAEYVEIFAGQHIAYGDLGSKVRRWWDLDALTLLYAALSGPAREHAVDVIHRRPQSM